MNQPSNRSGTNLRRKSLVGKLAIYAFLVALLYFALRNAPFIEIWEALSNLESWEVGLVLLINALVITCMTARWWIIVHAENPTVPFLPMIGYRLSVFALSYFTPGPQVGGEPLQVIYLQRRHGLTFARAASAVIMDKLLEFLVNFLLIGIGAWAIFNSGLISRSGFNLPLSLIGLAVLMMLPLAQVILLYNGFHPITRMLLRQPFIHESNKIIRTIIVAERMASVFCRNHVRAMFLAILVSLAAIAGIALEYFLMVYFLNIKIDAIQILAAITFMQIAFLMPLPGGLGALEASQVFVLGAFGHSASAAISLTLLMRARDLLNGGLGLVLAGLGFKDTINQ